MKILLILLMFTINSFAQIAAPDSLSPCDAMGLGKGLLFLEGGPEYLEIANDSEVGSSEWVDPDSLFDSTGSIEFIHYNNGYEKYMTINWGEKKIDFNLSGVKATLSFVDSVTYSGDIPVSKGAELFFTALDMVYQEYYKDRWEYIVWQTEAIEQYQKLVDSIYREKLNQLLNTK